MPELTAANRVLMWIVQRIGPALTDGMGGFNVRAAETALRLSGVPEPEHGYFMNRLVQYISLVHEARKKHGKKDG